MVELSSTESLLICLAVLTLITSLTDGRTGKIAVSHNARLHAMRRAVKTYFMYFS